MFSQFSPECFIFFRENNNFLATDKQRTLDWSQKQLFLNDRLVNLYFLSKLRTQQFQHTFCYLCCVRLYSFQCMLLFLFSGNKFSALSGPKGPHANFVDRPENSNYFVKNRKTVLLFIIIANSRYMNIEIRILSLNFFRPLFLSVPSANEIVRVQCSSIFQCKL